MQGPSSQEDGFVLERPCVENRDFQTSRMSSCGKAEGTQTTLGAGNFPLPLDNVPSFRQENHKGFRLCSLQLLGTISPHTFVFHPTAFAHTEGKLPLSFP